jgi:hypothetical protein
MSQGTFHVERDLSGRVKIVCPPVMLVPPDVAVEMAKAILKYAGAEVVMADPGTTVIRPNGGNGKNGKNGNGKVLR